MQRLPFVDWARGFAVIAMVLWHSADGWLRPGLKAGEGFYFLRFVGGLAAPSFLFLAGMAAALSARQGKTADERARVLLASLARGAEVLLLGYALRLQTWVIDADALRQPTTYRAWLPITLGYLLLWRATRTLGKEPSRALAAAGVGLALAIGGFLQVDDVASGRLPRLLQVDVLQAIGASLMLVALLERVCRLSERPSISLSLALLVLAVTALVASKLPGSLPVPLAAYLGRIAYAPGEPNPALFPLLPWFAYALVGASLGALMRRHHQHTERVLAAALLVGCVAALCASEAHAGVRELIAKLPESVPLVRAVYRLGIVLTLLMAGHAYARTRWSARLVDFGRNSLRIYWAHLLFAYGIFSRPLHAQLGYAAWAALATVLLVAMWLLSRIKGLPQPSSVRA